MPTVSSRAARRAVLAVALLLGPAHRAAAAEASLEFFYGPNQSSWLTQRTLEVKVDGTPLTLPAPPTAPGAGQPLFRGPLGAGAHRLDVVTALDGDSSVFTYVEGARVTMRGVLQLDAQPGDVVEVRAKIVRVEGLTVKWEDRARLALDATIRRTGQPAVEVAGTAAPVETSKPSAAVAAAAAAAPAPAPVAAPPAPKPAAAVAAAPKPAAACTLAPVRFAFDSSALTAEAGASLDAFAACLAASGRAVRLEGHCDGQGPDVYNEWLGAQRAAAAARHLRERGVAPQKITVRSMSAGSPVCTGGGRACNARNRRVEATVLE
jgi:outer membrane protein OmpA-like peptidoglycan-associated protein